VIFEYKLDGAKSQYAALDEAISIVQFIGNKCLRLWMDQRGICKNDLQCSGAGLAKDYPFARALNSPARQASADRAWCAISRFSENCKSHQPGKNGYPRFQHDQRSREYKTTGWKLEPDGKHISLTDGCGIGRVRLLGNPKQKSAAFPTEQIKRVRIVHRAEGSSVQFSVKAEREIVHQPTGKQVGMDVGLKAYSTDSDGNTLDNPRHYRKAQQKLKRLQPHVSRKQKQSANRKKARKQLARAHLQVQRQREDFARKTASTLLSSHDVIAFEDVKIRTMLRNHHLAKSIHDAGWGTFISWVKAYGLMHNVPVIAVAPHFTSQECSACSAIVKKSLSVRTHICPSCGVVLDRDHNAALNILAKTLACTLGHRETSGSPENASGQTASTRTPKRATGKRAG
jgi:putative transposase